VILESERAHTGLRGVDGDLNHVLRPVDEIRGGMDVAVDGALQQLVFGARINLEHLRVVFEHLIEIVFRIEFLDPFHSQYTAYQQLLAASSAAKSHINPSCKD